MATLVETFLNYEADPHLKDSRGFTALRLDSMLTLIVNMITLLNLNNFTTNK